MQKVQALSQPGAIETQARNASPRAAGSALGKVSVYSRTSICGPSVRRPLQQVEQLRQGVRADDDVDPRGLALDHALILLGEAAGDHDPQARVARP